MTGKPPDTPQARPPRTTTIPLPPDRDWWEGPIHGALGVLATDGERVQCHICGHFFRSLATHVTRGHGLPADEYRALFGLRHRTGLVGPTLREQLRQRGAPVLGRYQGQGQELLATATPEQRSAWTRGRTLRLEAKLDAHNQRAHQERTRLAVQRKRHLLASGEQAMPRPRDPRAAGRKGAARRRELLRDPAYRARLAQAVSEAKGGRVAVVCAICEKSFDVQPARVRRGQGKVCGKRCLRELQRRLARDAGLRQREPIARQLRAVGPAAFAALMDQDRAIVAHYYGLAGGTPHTQAELATQLNLTEYHVRRILKQSVRRLLDSLAAAETAGARP